MLLQNPRTIARYESSDSLALAPHSMSTSSPAPSLEPMALSLSYWEQTANALLNLYDLQGWASTVNIRKVLQPSILLKETSAFRFATPNQKALGFEDLFDVRNWNAVSVKKNVSQLVTLEHFLRHASREVVYVGIIKDCPEDPFPGLKETRIYKFLTTNGFSIVKKACLKNMYYNLTSFREQIFAGLENRNVSIVFAMWKGINHSFRIKIMDYRKK